MNDFFKKISGQLKGFFNDLSPMKKVAFAATGAIVTAVLGVMFYWAGEKAYRPLMTNLSPEDSANIIRVLRSKNIPFKVDQSGTQIEVPPESVHELRLQLATLGLPESSSVGYEIFDKQSLGATSYLNNVNAKRALEGELMRTIRNIKGVRKSRVHLAIPKKSTFMEDQKSPTASIVVDLEPGVVLNEKQIYGIGVMVARAVEGLDPSDVVIVHSNGKVLSNNPKDSMIALSANQLEYQRNYEESLEKRVVDMLGKVVGEGKVVAKVTADLDFSRVSETQKLFDADGAAVRSQNTQVVSSEGSRPGPVGPAGARTNQPEAPGVANPNQVRTNTRNERGTTNFEVPSTVRQVTKPYGALKKLSIAVVVDSKKTNEKDGNGVATNKLKPWTPEELAEFKNIVTGALGIDAKRGDTIEIKNVEFAPTDFDEAERLVAEHERRSYVRNLVIYGVVGVIIALFFLFVVRPYIKWVTENTIDSVDSYLPQTLEELEKLQKDVRIQGMEEQIPMVPEKVDPEKVEGEMIKEKIITLVDNNPQKAALILKDWLHGEENKKKPGEAANQAG